MPFLSRLLFIACLMIPAGALAQPPAEGEDTTGPDAKSNKRLVIATREVPPFVLRADDGTYVGITIDLLSELRPDLNSAGGEPIALEFREMGLAEMLDAVEAGEVDLAAAALTVSLPREKRFDFSHSYYESGLGIAVIPESGSGWGNVLRQLASPEFLAIVGTLFAMLLGSGFVMYLVERSRNREQFGGGWKRGVGTGIWWSVVTLTTVGYGDKAPRTALGRSLAIVWMLSGIIIFSTFTAAITAALTVDQLRSRIRGPNDLADARVITVAGSTSAEYLRREHIPTRAVDDVSEALAALKEGRVDAVVYDAPILRYLVHENYPDVLVLDKTFERQEYAIAMPTGSLLREPINRGLLRVTNSPQWTERLANYFGEK